MSFIKIIKKYCYSCNKKIAETLTKRKDLVRNSLLDDIIINQLY